MGACGHPAFLAPSVLFEGETTRKPRAKRAAGMRRRVLSAVIARSNATTASTEAPARRRQQSRVACVALDCFAEPVIGPAKRRTRWLAMTEWQHCHPEAPALRCTCTAGRASKDERPRYCSRAVALRGSLSRAPQGDGVSLGACLDLGRSNPRIAIPQPPQSGCSRARPRAGPARPSLS